VAIFPNLAAQRLRDGQLALGFGVNLLRTVAAPLIARSAGYHWLFIDMEHGAISLHDATQLCIAALPVGITPIVRIAGGAFSEGIRVLDNGAQGIIVPHVDTPEQARDAVLAFCYPPMGRRSWGANVLPFGYQAPPLAQAREQVNAQLLVIAMIESEQGVANADAIAATPGIDVLLMGAADMTAEMDIPGQWGHERVQQAFTTVAEACRKHGKTLGSGGIYDSVWSRHYARFGARFVAGGNDQGFILSAARERAQLLSPAVTE
jgi:2-keto-3-deoxy-L-rhamnonate aldolase RhmA